LEKAMTQKRTIIVAVDRHGGFAKAGKIPWYFKEDFKYFKQMTDGKVCVMGRASYDEMVATAKEKNRDITKGILPNRECFVVSNSQPDEYYIGATRVKSLSNLYEIKADAPEIMIFGGEKIFIEALPYVQTILLTAIDNVYDCDRFFPTQVLDSKYKITDGKKVIENDTTLHFMTYTRSAK